MLIIHTRPPGAAFDGEDLYGRSPLPPVPTARYDHLLLAGLGELHLHQVQGISGKRLLYEFPSSQYVYSLANTYTVVDYIMGLHMRSYEEHFNWSRRNSDFILIQDILKSDINCNRF